MVYYRELCAGETGRSLFYGFQRRQTVTKCWRREDGRWVLRDLCYTEDWSEADFCRLAEHFREILSGGGFVYAAFRENQLKGFAAVGGEWLDSRGKSLDLIYLHVSEDMRRKGIGRELFLAAAAWAGKKGAKKLYISAHSSAETQAFYRALGCVEAECYDRRHVEEEPFDCQLEYRLQGTDHVYI